MEILLVDLILGAHSARFASHLKRELEKKKAVSNVEFLTVGNDEAVHTHFDSMADVHVINHSSDADDTVYSDFVVDSYREMVELIRQRSYSIVHLLQADNVLIESALVLNSTTGLPPVVAQINGAFFGGDGRLWPSVVYRGISLMLSSPISGLIEPPLARWKLHKLPKDAALYRCLQKNMFDHVLVHTHSAKEYIFELYKSAPPVTVVPEPSTVDQPAFSQETAREKIGVDPNATVLLFFGGLRWKKGIDFLLQSLQNYEGPEFTLLVAGPEQSVSKERVEQAEDSITPSLSTNIRYIYDSEKYFLAADGVICPYLEEFGEERTSHVLQEAIKLRRPVICPAFGSFESRLNSYDLGVLYSPQSAQALNGAIRDFVADPEQWYSTSDMASFSEKHSFENLSSMLLDIYEAEV